MYGILVMWYREPYNEVVEMELLGTVESVDDAKAKKAAWLAAVKPKASTLEYTNFYISRKDEAGRYLIEEDI